MKDKGWVIRAIESESMIVSVTEIAHGTETASTEVAPVGELDPILPVSIDVTCSKNFLNHANVVSATVYCHA